MNRSSFFFLFFLLILPVVSAGLLDFLMPEPQVFMITFYPKDVNFNTVQTDTLFAFDAHITNLFAENQVVDLNILGDLNVDGDLNVGGDSNFQNIGVSGQSFFGNFVNLFDNPTRALHAATKEYVDKAVAGADFDLFLFEIASTDVGGYQQLKRVSSEQPEESDTETVNTDNFLIQAFVTEQSDINISTLSEGVYSLHIHASAVTVGKKDVRLFWRFFGRDPDGTEVQIGSDSEETIVLTSVETQYEIHLNTVNEVEVDGNRFVVKIFANLEGVGGDPNTTIFYEGTTSSRAEFKTVDLSQTSHDLLLNREWADANHTFIQTGETMDIGSYNFNVGGDSNFTNIGLSGGFVGLNVIDDANFVNIGMSGGFTGLNAIGDSNFTNIGISENAWIDGSVNAKGTGTFAMPLILDAGTANLEISHWVGFESGISFQYQKPATDSFYTFHSKDGDATDWSVMYIVGKGTPEQFANLEYLLIGYRADLSIYEIGVYATGSGTQRDFRILTGHGDYLYFDAGGIGINKTNPTNDLDIAGTFAISGTSTFSGDIQAGGTSNFAGDVTLSNQIDATGGNFYLRRLSQSAAPSGTDLGVGELSIWNDSDNSDVWLSYRDTDDGYVKVQLT